MLWSGSLQIMEERNGFKEGNGRRWFQRGVDVSGTVEGAGGINGLVAILEENATGGISRTLLPVSDGLGSVTVVIDQATGAQVARFEFGPFGEPLGESGETWVCPFRWQTKWYDAESQQYYFGYRYYDPRLGRWLSRDPIREAGGFNLYAYCGNDPVNRHDPLGLADFTLPDGSLDSSRVHNILDFLDLMTTDFPAKMYRDLRGLPVQVNQGMAQARRDIDARIDSGEYGPGTAFMARGLQFTGTFSAGVTMAPLQPVDTTVGLVTSPVVLPYNLGTSLWEFGSEPSLSKGFDVVENGVNVGLMFEGAGALQSRFPALQNLRVPSLPSFQLRPTWNPLNYRFAMDGLGSFGYYSPRYVGPKINVGPSGHHVPGVRKTLGRLFEVGRGDKTRPAIFSRGIDPAHDHWRLHNAERPFVGPRQGPFPGTDSELFAAYRKAYQGLDDIRVDVRSPDGTHVLGNDVTPLQAVNLIEAWLIEQGLR
jgi:RHS repeat-associated protein